MSTIRFDTRFPGYEVLSELGRSNARILKARHLATGDLVAIKHFALNTDDETLRRFQRESAIMTSIAHPNIVKVREVQLEAELLYIVMELIEGGNLHQLIAGQGQIDVPTTIRLGLQMASAFKAIHPQGIVHRDIKPENILFRPLPSGELHFLLTDFGVARLHEQSNTLTGQSLMTYEYASPEQFNDPKGVGVATDYYSLGVVLYECLHGSVPFALDDHSGIVTFMNKVLTEAPPALTIAPNDQPISPFRELLQGLLQKKAADRLSDPDELTWLLKQAELNYLQANRASHTQPVTPPRVTSAAPTAPKLPETNVVDSASPVGLPDQTRKQRKPILSGPKLGVFLVIILLVSAGLYYAFLKSKSTGLSTILETSKTEAATSERPDLKEEVALHQKETEEAIRKEQLRQEALAAGKALSVKAADFRVGFFGGIKNLKLQLNNPSSITFPAVAVQVRYYKDNGGLYKTEKVFFMNVAPNSSPVRQAPDSDRGTRISCKILKYDFPKNLDSLMQAAPTATDSLN